jgi:hypothetical protein
MEMASKAFAHQFILPAFRPNPFYVPAHPFIYALGTNIHVCDKNRAA